MVEQRLWWSPLALFFLFLTKRADVCIIGVVVEGKLRVFDRIYKIYRMGN